MALKATFAICIHTIFLLVSTQEKGVEGLLFMAMNRFRVQKTVNQDCLSLITH